MIYHTACSPDLLALLAADYLDHVGLDNQNEEKQESDNNQKAVQRTGIQAGW